jgi:hypothetical protein
MINADKYVRAFERFLVGKPSSDGEWRAFCPLDEDPETSKSPSASLNFEAGVWHCQSRGHGGTIRSLYRTMKNQRGMESPAARKEKGDRSNVVNIDQKKPLPTPEQVEFWHKSLMGSPRAHKYVSEERGLKDETMRKYLIGWDGQRFTIPVYDEDGELVNIRRYNPRARSHKDKMISWGPGHGSGRIYGLEVLKEHDEVLYAEGEWDRLIAMQEGFPAVTDTSGAAVFKPEWARYFKGKTVYFAFDDDKQGDAGAMKATQYMKNVAAGCFRITLGTGIDGGDLTDFFASLGRSADDLWQLHDEATPLWLPEEKHVVPVIGRPVTVEESQNVNYAEPLELTVMIVGKQTPAFIAPKRLTGTCGMNAGAVCNLCPLMVNDGKLTKDIEPDDEKLLHFVNVGEARKRELYSEITGAMCKKFVDFDVEQSFNIEELVVTPSLDYRSEDTETPIQRRVFNVGTYSTPINQTVKIIGKQVAESQTQRGTFMGWHLQTVNTDLEEFQMTPRIMQQLKRFQVKEGQTPLDKCMEIARDMASNVTHIYGRPMLHVAYDLVWHSVTQFDFDNKPVRKGWLEALIIGDTRTGKSEAVTHLRRHYGAGVIKSCEGASFAGLVGGAQNVPGAKSGWIVTWGVLPLNDRRLVVLDEMSGLMAVKERNILGDMSSVRSEGKAVISKIVSDETSSRTRIIWLSNPADGTRIADLPGSALRAIKQLIRNPEDIARLDFAMAVANNEVDANVINSTEHKPVRHRYTSDACHNLIMWAWSRKKEQVIWGRGTEQVVYDAAINMGQRYVSDPPLVQVENIRMKIARLAVAIAARTFSCSKNGDKIWVRRSHVESAVQFLDEVYSSEAMGYMRSSRRVLVTRQEAQDSKGKVRQFLKGEPHVLAAVRAIGAETFRSRDFEEQAALTKDEANLVMRSLTEWRMISREARGAVRFEPAMTEVLRELEDSGY